MNNRKFRQFINLKDRALLIGSYEKFFDWVLNEISNKTSLEETKLD